MKYIFLVTIFLSSLCSINAQYKESDLQGKVWKAIKGYFAESVADCYMTFSSGSVLIETKEKSTNKTIYKKRCRMYLSSEKTDVADSSLVGKGQEGKYIIVSGERVVKGGGITETFWAEILSVDNSTLLLKFTQDGETTILKAQ